MWSFDQPESCATIVPKSILRGEKPILLVSHDEDDHGWQFLDGESDEVEDLEIVCLSHILEIDQSMANLASMEPGFQAVRFSTEAGWVIEKSPEELDDNES